MDSMQHSVLRKCTYPKTASSSLLNAPKQHTIQTRSPPDKNITRKQLFRVNTSLFWSTKWKGNSSLWPHGPSDKYRHYYYYRKTKMHTNSGVIKSTV